MATVPTYDNCARRQGATGRGLVQLNGSSVHSLPIFDLPRSCSIRHAPLSMRKARMLLWPKKTLHTAPDVAAAAAAVAELVGRSRCRERPDKVAVVKSTSSSKCTNQSVSKVIQCCGNRTPTRGRDRQPHQGAGLEPQVTTEHLKGSHTKGLG
eukprot:365421-Chlamydomonas_euryale.AAC.4